MATFSAKVFKHHKKADGTYNVKICISHKRERVYFDTTHYVVDKQLNKDFKIKDQFINSILNRTLDEYRKCASELEKRLELFDAESLKQYLLKKEEKIDFLRFCHIHIDRLKNEGRNKSASNYNTIKNSILDFLNWKTTLPIEQITTGFINEFERYLRGKRILFRKNQFGKEYKMAVNPLSDSSIHNYLRDFKGLYAAAMTHYNKQSLGLVPIKYNPFSDYRIIEPPETRKRNIDIEELKLIRDCEVKKGSRGELARDLFMLSFYLCGANAVDFYNSNYVIKNGRFEYNRSKTKGKRKDRAFISIKIPNEAHMLISKHLGILNFRYSSVCNLNAALSEGMRDVCKLTKLSDVTFYWARHSFANIARNKCRMSKDDVALVLNHVDVGRKTTDIYLEKDWSIVDEVQESVLSLLRAKNANDKHCYQFQSTRLLPEIQLPILV